MRVSGMRAYERFKEDRFLEPYASSYAAIFGNRLDRSGLKSPRYQEIYVWFAPTLKEAKEFTPAALSWHKYAPAEIDPRAYARASEKRREEMIIDAIEAALLRLATSDRLDKKIIKKVSAEIREHGRAIELEGPGAENKTHRARVVYQLQPKRKTDFWLRVDELATGRSVRLPLGKEDLLWWPYRFKSVRLTKKEVRVSAGTGVRAKIHIGRTKKVIKFQLDDIF
jgi:hypothetical protein